MQHFENFEILKYEKLTNITINIWISKQKQNKQKNENSIISTNLKHSKCRNIEISQFQNFCEFQHLKLLNFQIFKFLNFTKFQNFKI